MDFPLLKTFEVEPWIIESLLEFLEDLKINLPKNPYIEETAFSNLSDSYATDNLLDTDFPKLDIFTKFFLNKASNLLNLPEKNINLFWVHFLDYGKEGEMGFHNHAFNEDFVMFIYLSTCEDGETIWQLNSSNEESKERTSLSCLPEKGKGAIFSSLLDHCGAVNKGGTKKLCVVGLRIKLD